MELQGIACDAGLRVVDRIKAEHALLARILGAMQAWVVRSRPAGAIADPGLFGAMLRYVAEVPERIHHPQEDAILFPALSGVAQAQDVIAELQGEHARGAAMLEALRAAFGAVEAGEPNAINRLSTAVDEYAEFYWAHMRKEERELLPVALARLGPAQWESIERAFVVVNDPLFGSEVAAPYRALFGEIAGRIPGSLKAYLEEVASPR